MWLRFYSLSIISTPTDLMKAARKTDRLTVYNLLIKNVSLAAVSHVLSNY